MQQNNVILYYRVSTQEQVDDGFSIPGVCQVSCRI